MPKAYGSPLRHSRKRGQVSFRRAQRRRVRARRPCAGARVSHSTVEPESDGTLEWSATALVVVEIEAGDCRGLGYMYADAATARVIKDVLIPWSPSGTRAPLASGGSKWPRRSAISDVPV